ncbi:MAG: Maf family nucleotide pyrophosphatase [Cellulomonas sp.]|nr:Maf family nucleotide pyrophosphatase [Cellulomonas sp.]
MTRLLLASASPARLATLRSAGFDPLVRVSDVDEPAVLAAAATRLGEFDVADAVLLLAQAKALDVASAVEDEGEIDDLLVLGCDSLLELDGEPFGKPVDAQEATERWRTMRGRIGVLHTGHWLVDTRPTAPDGPGSGATLGATASTRVHFADVSDAEIDAYVATGEPLAVAGAFTLDGWGGPFVEGVEGDPHSVVGVSLPLLRALLGEVGVSVPELWRRG